MRRLFLILNCLLLVVACVVLVPAFVLAAVPSSYNSYGYATGVHYIAGSDAFPNFQNGAVNNRYPLAEVAQDASPSSTAVATYIDSGPLTATAGSSYNQGCTSGDKPPPPQICQNPNNSVPYAKATYPGGPGHSHIDGCNGSSSCPDSSPRADSDAAELNASASGYYAGGGTQPFSGASGKTTTVMDSNGSLTVVTHSEVQSWSMGAIKVNKITVDVTATSTMSGGSGTATVVGGEVTDSSGKSYKVTDQGATFEDKQPIPCTALPKPPPQPAPPTAPPAPPPPPLVPPVGGLPVGGSGAPSGGSPSGGSSSAPSSGSPSSSCVPGVDITYIKMFTVAPTKTVDGSHVTIWATGLHIIVTHPSAGAGVPQQSSEYILGEGFADTLAGSSAASAFDFGGFGGFGDFGGFGGFGGFDQTGLGAGSGGPAGSLGAALVANRVPLAFLFLTLEALLLASAAAWVWARNTPIERVPDEVLTP
jgi:hypothetical protein